jgi:probable F420-dependent oxidoreductase
VKVGVNVINFGPDATVENVAGWARVAESLGYHLVMTSDHVALTPDVHARYPAPFYEPFTALGYLAAVTRRVELGTTVIVLPYRHPLETARMATAVDRLSGGRFVLGVGVGWARQEFEVLGVPFERRGAITDEYLRVIDGFWGADVLSWQGRFARFTDVQTGPRPVRQPRPPIWVGGASDAALRRAVRHGDAWHPIRVRVDWARDVGLPRLRAIAEAEGRAVPHFCPRIRLRLTPTALGDRDRLAGEGSLDQVRADLEALAELGARYVVLDAYSEDADTMRPARAWEALATLAARVLDLPRCTLR